MYECDCYYAVMVSGLQHQFPRSICLIEVFRLRQYALLLLLSAGSGNALSAENPVPSGSDLLLACEESIESGYNSTRGMLCIWYVTPCDCDAGKKPDLPRVCLPADVSHEQLTLQVVRELRQKPLLQEQTAEAAAASILAPLYPCGEESRNN